jgi:hypothetical protein
MRAYLMRGTAREIFRGGDNICVVYVDWGIDKRQVTLHDANGTR